MNKMQGSLVGEGKVNYHHNNHHWKLKYLFIHRWIIALNVCRCLICVHFCWWNFGSDGHCVTDLMTPSTDLQFLNCCILYIPNQMYFFRSLRWQRWLTKIHIYFLQFSSFISLIIIIWSGIIFLCGNYSIAFWMNYKTYSYGPRTRLKTFVLSVFFCLITG